MTIEVWAPRADRVRLRRPGCDDVDLTAGDVGWWRSDVALVPGDEYGFVLGGPSAGSEQERALRQQIQVEGRTVELERQLFEIEQERTRLIKERGLTLTPKMYLPPATTGLEAVHR